MVVSNLAWQTVSEVVLRIHLDLDRSWTLNELATETGYTPQHLSTLFRSVVGEPPLRYIRSLRIERAAFALADHADRPISEIAEEAGYTSLEAFTRAFKRATGQAPAEFRDDARWVSEPPSGHLGLAELEDSPPGLGTPPTLAEVGPLYGWMSRIQMDPGQIAQTLFALNAVAPPTGPYQFGGLSHPWGYVGGPREPELYCVRYLEAPRRPVPVPFQELRLPRTWYFRFDYAGATAGISAACEWLVRTWIPRCGLRPGFAPVLSQLEVMRPDPVRAYLYVSARGLGPSFSLAEEEPAAADEYADIAEELPVRSE